LYYQAADFFVLPTLDLEGFGLVTLEALACGTPVLGTPVGETVEILSGLNPYLLFASSRPEDMARGILEHLSAPAISRERCRRYVLEHYSWDRTTIELEALFRMVTE
jgi:glycosyltransferase involved in cell wall biosynthesis